MTNLEKNQLRHMCQDGWTFEQIRRCVSCSDATIKKYMKAFSPPTPQTTNNEGSE